MFTTAAKTRRKAARFLALAVFLLIQHSADSQAQDLILEHLTVEQGLSDNGVWSILQDRRGFMWFATANGLNKYDGYDFTVYKWNPLDTNSNRAANVGWLYEDNSGALWFGGPGGGVSRFDRVTGKFSERNACGPMAGLYEDQAGTLWFATGGKGLKKYDRTSGVLTQYRLSSDTLFCICADSNEAGQVLWVGGAGGLDRFNPANGTFTHVDQRSVYRVTAVHKDRAGTLWIGTNEGVYTLDEATGTRSRHPVSRWGSTSPWQDVVHSFYEDRIGNLWIGAGTDLFCFERATGKFLQVRTKPHLIPEPIAARNPVFEDRKGSLWLRNLGQGLCRLDSARNTIASYLHDRNDPWSLSDNVVNQIYEGRSGSLWIATVWGGVNKIDLARKAFRHYAHHPAYAWSLAHNTVHGICEDRWGRLWLATRGGLERFDRKTGKFTHFQHNPGDPHSLSSNNLRAVLEDHDGTIWVGTEVCGLDRLDPVRGGEEGTTNGRFQHYTHSPADSLSIGSNRILTLALDRSGKIWIGTADAGLDQFSKDTGFFIHYRSNPGDSSSLRNNWVNAIHEDTKGGLWVGTGGADSVRLQKLDRTTGKFINYKSDPVNPKSMDPGSVHSIHEDRRGTLWIGTTFGLNRLEPSTGTFTRIEASRKNVGDFYSGILEDRSGCLWLKTNKGLSKFDPRTGKFRTYDRSDGVPISSTWGKASCLSRNGEMYFGGTNGFVRFHPDSIKDNPYIPPVVITAFKIFDNPVSFDTVISEKKVLQLSARDNVISFEFVALNYSSPEKNQYAYKLEGFDQEWTYCGTRRYASYTNLDAGTYVFRVRGSNNDGVWNDEGTSIAVFIAPPWWKTGWAFGIYAILLVSVVYFTWKLQVKRIRLRHEVEMTRFEAEKLREVDSMKTRFFANISHEFRTPLTLILGPAEKLLSRDQPTADREDLSIVRRSALQLLELITQVMDISKLEAGKMKVQVEETDLIPFLRGLVLSFASLAERKRIRLGFRPAGESITGYVDRDKVQKIVTNLLSNAFKFTPEGGEVCVGVSASGGGDHSSGGAKGFIEICVSDSGAGVSNEEMEKIFDRFYQANSANVREHAGTGIGLALTKELVEIHHGQISVTSGPGKGSTFRVRLPMGRGHWDEDQIITRAEGEEESQIAVPASPLQISGEEGTGDQDNVVPELAGEDRPLVLIVEDNEDVLRFIRNSLAQQYRVEEAVDGVAAAEAARDHVPDLVVSDIVMPKMDGVELCRSLKTDERTSHIPVILLTARASAEGKLEGLESGADDYIIKPFDVRELQARIQNLIELRKTLREKYRRHCVLEPGEIVIESMDEKFLRKALDVVEKHLSETGFETSVLAREVCMSRMQLNRKLHALTGRSTHQFIRNIRMQRAAKLLESHWGNVTEVAFAVGFTSLSSFAKAFREEYGVSPSRYWSRDA